jgi:hypothetical protein
MSDGCCASTVSTDFRGDLDPVFDAMNSGDYDAALRQFVAIVRAEAGEPRDAIRRIPDGI